MRAKVWLLLRRKISVMMKNYPFLLLTALLALIFSACNQRQEVEKLQKETETVHDEAMKSMADMNRSGRALKQLLPALDSLPARRDSILDVLSAMNRAEEDMMTWMRQYKAPDEQSVEQALLYLREQKQKIEQNRQDIRKALEAGKNMQGQ